MKAKWRRTTIDQIADNLDSRRKPITKDVRTAGDIPYYGASGIVDYVADYIFDEELLLISEDGANLLARSTAIAFPVSGKCWVNNHAHVLKFENRFTQRFVEFYFESISVDSYVKGAAQPKLTQRALNSIPIPLPPLPEQQRIVGILDEAFEGISTVKANAEKNLQTARALFESHLEAVFTRDGDRWATRRLGDIAETQYGLSVPMNDVGKGYRIFRMGELQDGRLTDTGQMRFADIPREEFERYKLHPGDVLFNRTNSYELVGKTGIFNLRGDYCFASYLVRVNLDRKILLPTLLNYFMNSKMFQKSVKTKASRSINQANINASILADEIIHFPQSLQAQGSIIVRLDALRAETQHLESIYQQKLTALEALKKSLFHQAFTGEL